MGSRSTGDKPSNRIDPEKATSFNPEVVRRFAVLDARPRTDDGPVELSVVIDEIMWALEPVLGKRRAPLEKEVS